MRDVIDEFIREKQAALVAASRDKQKWGSVLC